MARREFWELPAAALARRQSTNLKNLGPDKGLILPEVPPLFLPEGEEGSWRPWRRRKPVAGGETGLLRPWQQGKPVAFIVRWTRWDFRGCTRYTHNGSEGLLRQGRWTWYRSSKWTWSTERESRQCARAWAARRFRRAGGRDGHQRPWQQRKPFAKGGEGSQRPGRTEKIVARGKEGAQRPGRTEKIVARGGEGAQRPWEEKKAVTGGREGAR